MGSFINSINVNVGRDEVVSVSQEELNKIVSASIVYPKAESMEDKEIKNCEIKFTYKCDSKTCLFADVIKSIQQSAILNQKGVKETSEAIIDTIEKNQSLFTTREVGGYVLQAMGNPLLFLENGSIQRSPETPVGFIDLTEVRRGLIYKEIQRKKIERRYLENCFVLFYHKWPSDNGVEVHKKVIYRI